MTRRAHVTRWFAAGIAMTLVTTTMVALADDAPVAPAKPVPTPTKPAEQSAPTQQTAPATANAVPSSTNASAVTSDAPERDEPTLTAKEAFDRAVDAYAGGDKVTALNDMEQSYALSHRAELLYNIAKIERDLHQCTSALVTYQRYLRDDPTGTQRDAANDGVRVLSAQCLRPAQPAIPTPPSSPMSPSYWTAPHLVGWSAIIAGAAAGTASLALGVASNGPAETYRRTLSPPEYERAERLRNGARIFGVAGGVLAAGGVLCLTFWHPQREQSAPSVSLAVSPDGAAFGYARRF
jgi:hypothetical protein